MKHDIETLKWVLEKASELNNKIWDLREAIHEEIETQKQLKNGKEEINLLSERGYGNGV